MSDKLYNTTFTMGILEKQALTELAKANDMKMSQYLRMLIRQDAKSKDIWSRIVKTNDKRFSADDWSI